MFTQKGTIVIAKRLGIGAVRSLVRGAEAEGLKVQKVTPWDLEFAAEVELEGDLILIEQVDRCEDAKAIFEVVRRTRSAGKKVALVVNDSEFANRTRDEVLKAYPEMRKTIFA